METDELIHAIAADGVRAPAPARALTASLAPALAVAIGLFFATLGLRLHFLALLGEPRFVFKLLLLDLLAALSGLLVLRLARPAAPALGPLLLLAIPLLLLAAAIGAELLLVPATEWGRRLIGSNAMVCLRSIPFLGLAPLVAIFIALRSGAPEQPALAGAAAGLFAGALGGAIYAGHCPDDSPLFIAVWYPLGIAVVAAAGAVLGSRLLRW